MDDRRAFTISDTQNTLYKELKATTDEQEYFDHIVEKRKLEMKQEYHYDVFRLKKNGFKNKLEHLK